MGFWAHSGRGCFSGKEAEGPDSSLILSTRENGGACWGSWWFGQSKGHHRGYLSPVPPLLDPSNRMGQGKRLGCCSAVPPPSSPGDQGPGTLNRGTTEGALCLSGSRSCKERKGRSCCLGMSRVAKYSRAVLCPSPLLPLHSRPRLLVVSAGTTSPASCLPATQPVPTKPAPTSSFPSPRTSCRASAGSASEWGWAGWALALWGAWRGG